MKGHTLLATVLFAVGCLALSALALAVPPKPDGPSVGVYGGYARLSTDNQLGNAAAMSMRPGSGGLLGARFSLGLGAALAAEAEVDYTMGAFADSGLASSVLGWRASAVWHFADGSVRPFGLLGAGGVTTVWAQHGTEHDTDLSGHAGTGLKVAVTDRVGVRADLRWFMLDGATARLAHNFAGHLGLTVLLAVPVADADRDGLGDAVDKCPDQAEDKDGFEDSDGCPDLDNDQDGIADAADHCPNAVEDADGFEDADGCPDPDNDGDGVVDAADKCPVHAEDSDGFEDSDGCPELDNDKDGIVDGHDKCPNQSGKAEDAGCPPADQDEDGIADKLDKCPDSKETFNGKDDDDGCPDGAETVVVSKLDIKILQKVYFELGLAHIKPESHKLLDTVAAVLRQQQRLTKVAIEGHTDDLGVAEDNQVLSQRRAEAVLAYFVGKGVAASRLVAVGLGSSRPLCGELAELLKNEAKNRKKIEHCREQNRRVQFVVLEIDGSAVGPR